MVGWRTDQFDSFSSYLRDRGLQLQWRLTIYVFTLVLGTLPVVLLSSSLGPNGTLPIVIAIAVAVCAAGASLLWLVRWPTRAQSLVYNLACCGCTAATCLVLSSPYAGLMACTVFAMIGGLLAYFHAIAHVIANLGVAAICAAINASRLMMDTGDISLTVSAVLTVTALNVGVPFGIYSLVHSLHTDLRNSDRDALTGLLNRRSFYNAVDELSKAQRDPVGTRLNITMIDLDDFKRLNDTRGHAVGDEALVSVAGVLRHQSGDAILCRLGGEEFVLADTGTAERHAMTVERIRMGIAAAPFGVTASLGTCSAVFVPDAPIVHPDFIDRLIRVADAAMYQSKQAGGDRSQHRYLDQADADWH